MRRKNWEKIQWNKCKSKDWMVQGSGRRMEVPDTVLSMSNHKVPEIWWLWWIWVHLGITSSTAQQKEKQKEILWFVQWFSSCYIRTHRQIWPSPHDRENRILPNIDICQTTWHHTSEEHNLKVTQLEANFKIIGQWDHVMYHVAPVMRENNLGNVSTV
jgi:hypothetical protein